MVSSEFKVYLERQKKTEITIKDYLSSLRIAENFLGKPLDKTTTKEDIERFLNSISNKSANTITLRLIVLKVYFKWLYGMKKGYPDIVDFPSPKKSNNGLVSSDLLTEEDILKLINACDNLRDKALISLLYDSACRIGEITNLNIEDVVIESERTGYIVVNGKTGKRQVPLSSSIPILNEWINSHPLKENPKSPLFIALNNRVGKRTVEQNVNLRIKRYAERIGLKKRIFPHLFRHSRMTELDRKGLSHTAMKYYAGWSKNSNMPSVYSHFSAQDTKDLVYQADGITPMKRKKTILEPIVCVKCNTLNDKTNRYCYLCGMPLDSEAQKEFITQEMIKEFANSNPILSKALNEFISKKIEVLKVRK